MNSSRSIIDGSDRRRNESPSSPAFRHPRALCLTPPPSKRSHYGNVTRAPPQSVERTVTAAAVVPMECDDTEIAPAAEHEMPVHAPILCLPDEVLFTSLSYLSAADVEAGPGRCCRRVRSLSLSPDLWRQFCERTGKLSVGRFVAIHATGDRRQDIDSTAASELPSDNTDEQPIADFRRHYFSNACVPVDFGSISAAIKATVEGGTVTIFPGIYREEQTIQFHKNIALTTVQSPHENRRNLRYAIIATPLLSDSLMNMPLLSVDNPDVHITLTRIRAVHRSFGDDLWNGNCALFVNRGRAEIRQCSFQSDSGRGVVVSNGGMLSMDTCVVHDCAATGIYAGDYGTKATLTRTEVVRNGRGGECVPPGHSGLYVEGARVEVRGSFVGFNYLTGVSAVRDGHVSVTESDVFSNGAAPMIVEDMQDGSSISESGNNYNHTRTITNCPSIHWNNHVMPSPTNDMSNHQQGGAHDAYWNDLTQFLQLSDLLLMR
mmetsp:Transcript_49205/g.96224  ORF Transcript_49205/g.96224 Transcript_49205/m.96224 type:complete len:489 (+) Transcript_49205:63-1529(+)|eukprot:CAMPEP_0194338726 /NCGR_PEP_ID=MMETSP0171-20130528/80610_1 /TAXON_ID=218684 /ORGANISM="Corethron pennatum, Strain L29A3" /LENGTH=488 /DNA_ID=CAMNT_0039102973 /DNA_START=40 /DNA_END=1506 /DNA_ORIENTATION=+